LQLPFRVAEPDYDEPDLPVAPAELVRSHALQKARSVATEPGDGPVLGVDTAVVLADATVLGKPSNAIAARTMLAQLQGREHRVLSGLALIADGHEIVRHAETVVRFRQVTDAELDAYVAAGEWEGRAGAYAIQGLGAGLVTVVEGCYPNVVGLPVALLVQTLAEVGYPTLAGKPPAAG
jgi:septum formation protein